MGRGHNLSGFEWMHDAGGECRSAGHRASGNAGVAMLRLALVGAMTHRRGRAIARPSSRRRHAEGHQQDCEKQQAFCDHLPHLSSLGALRRKCQRLTGPKQFFADLRSRLGDPFIRTSGKQEYLASRSSLSPPETLLNRDERVTGGPAVPLISAGPLPHQVIGRPARRPAVLGQLAAPKG